MVAFASTSRLHEASLVDASTHNPALVELLQVELSKDVYDYAIDTTVSAVEYALGRRSSLRSPKFTEFVTNVLTLSETTFPTILTTLTYISRSTPFLHIALEQYACERVFLGALMVASKYTNDSTLKNVHWAMCTGVFGRKDVARIEREMLTVLDWDLAISEDDILTHHAALLHPTRTQPHPRHRLQADHHHHRRSSSVHSSHSSHSSHSASTLVDEEMQTLPKHSLVNVSIPQKKSLAKSTFDLIPIISHHQSVLV